MNTPPSKKQKEEQEEEEKEDKSFHSGPFDISDPNQKLWPIQKQVGKDRPRPEVIHKDYPLHKQKSKHCSDCDGQTGFFQTSNHSTTVTSVNDTDNNKHSDLVDGCLLHFDIQCPH